MALWGAAARDPRDRGAPVPRVEAETTLFYALPDAQRVLVRFHVHGTDAPAGRLRVYDTDRNLYGTAGVLPVGDGHLYGELFVPLARGQRLVSELSVPGGRPLWSFHTLRPGPRWLVHVLAIVDGDQAIERLNALPPLRRAVETAVLQGRPVRGNPVGTSAPALLDHLPLLQMGRGALRLERAYGVRASAVAAGALAQFDAATVPLALNGSGTRHVVVLGGAADAPATLVAPDGSALLVAPAGLVADMASLQMATGGDGMARAVERWLQSLTAPAGASLRPQAGELSAFVVGTSAEDFGTLAVRTAEEWNARYAYPRIVLDGTPPPLDEFGIRAGGPASPGAAWGRPADYAAPVLAGATVARLAERQRRAEAIVASLTHALTIADHDLAGLAARFASRASGTLVFNPSPFTRTDLATFPDGSERLVTDVPGNGYAFVPELPGESFVWAIAEPAARADGAGFRVELDTASGSIESLVTADGRDWVRSGGRLNDFPGARVTRMERLVQPGIATRLAVERSIPGRGQVRSTITLYDRYPWMDVRNATPDGGDVLPDTSFAFALDQPTVEWEIPAGYLDGVAPLEVAWLRWIRLAGEPGNVLLGGGETPVASIGDDGSVVVRGASRLARFRLALQPRGGDRYREDPWRHGWSMEPFVTASVLGNGALGLPSFGTLLQTSDPGAAIIGVEPQEDRTLLVYVQELLGITRPIELRSGIIRFSAARLSDLVGRDRAPLDAGGGLVRIELRARSVAAIKLLGLSAGPT